MKVLLLGHFKDTYSNYEEVLKSLGVSYDLKLDGDYSEYDRLIVPGGIDVDPSVYGKQKDPTVKIFDRQFDEAQLKAIDYFVKNNKPILGICRGQQILNVYFKGTLIQDIKSDIKHSDFSCDKPKDLYHTVSNVGLMKELYGEKCVINSHHHQAIDKLGEGLVVLSRSDDGIIEAVKHESLPILAVQWHPERLALDKRRDDCADGIIVIKQFLGL